MDDRRPVDAAQYALKERLKGWFGSVKRAKDIYGALNTSADELMQMQLAPCKYGINITRKLELAAAKLGDDGDIRLL